MALIFRFKKLLFFFILITSLCNAQEKQKSPIPVEFMFGNNKIYGQFNFNKDFKNNKFVYFNTTTIISDYTNNNNPVELVSTNLITYSLYKGFKATAGASFNSAIGFLPQIGFQYFFADKNFLIVVAPSAQLSNYNYIQSFAFVEFHPKLNDKINFYSRLQGLYSQNITDRSHDRSFGYFRLGISCNDITVGMGMNLDYYGPEKIRKENYGAFLKYNFM